MSYSYGCCCAANQPGYNYLHYLVSNSDRGVAGHATAGTDSVLGQDANSTTNDLDPPWLQVAIGSTDSSAEVGAGESHGVWLAAGGLQFFPISEPATSFTPYETENQDTGGGYGCELPSSNWTLQKSDRVDLTGQSWADRSARQSWQGQCVPVLSGLLDLHYSNAAMNSAGDEMVVQAVARSGSDRKLILAKTDGASVTAIQETSDTTASGGAYEFGISTRTDGGTRVHVMAVEDYTSCLGAKTEVTIDSEGTNGEGQYEVTGTVSVAVYEGPLTELGGYSQMSPTSLLHSMPSRTVTEAASPVWSDALKKDVLLKSGSPSSTNPSVSLLDHHTNRHGDTLSILQTNEAPDAGGDYAASPIDARLYLNSTLFLTDTKSETATGWELLDARTCDPVSADHARFAVVVRDKTQAGVYRQVLLDSANAVIWTGADGSNKIITTTDRHVLFGSDTDAAVGTWASVDGAKQWARGGDIPGEFSGIKNSASISWSVPLDAGGVAPAPETDIFS